MCKNEIPKYNLYNFIYHKGDFNFGHYKIFIKFKELYKQYELKELSLDRSMFENVYILFYINLLNNFIIIIKN